MTTRLYANNASDTLNGAITDSATTITLNDASEFPVPGAGEIAYATLDNSSGTVEIISYTGVSTNDLTGVTRAQDGTSASAFSNGDIVEVRATRSSFTDVLAADESPELRGPLNIYTNSQYISFGAGSTSSKYSLASLSTIPRLYGNTNFYYGFTGSSLSMQAGTNYTLTFENSFNGLRVTTNGSQRLQVNDNGITVSNGSIDVDNINIDANTISSTDTNGDINLTPNGTGNVVIGNYTFDADQTVGAGQDNYVLTYDNATGLVSLEVAAGAGGGDAWSDPVDSDIVPDADGTRDLGTTANRFAELHVDSMELAGTTTVSSILDEDTLVSDSATALATQQSIKAYADSIVGTIPAFRAYLSSNQSISSGVTTKAQIDTEVFDTTADYDNATNYRWTPSEAGKYAVFGAGQFGSGLDDGERAIFYIYKNGSSIASQMLRAESTNVSAFGCISTFIDMNGTTDYLEFYVNHNEGSAYNLLAGSGSTWFAGFKITE